MFPDPRLNALVVQANEEDLRLIEDLLKVIDREGSITEVQTAGVPRVIPIMYGSADEAAGIVRQVFADRISSGTGSQQRQPSPEDLIRALRGGRSGREQNQARGEQQKMTVGVDQRSNSLIITGPEHLFQQVEALVQQIDQPGSTDSDVVSVVPIRVSDPEVVQKTLASILGTSASSSTQRPSTSGQRPPASGASPDQMRQRMEFLQRLQSMGGGGRPAFGGGGGPGGGRPGGGGPGGSRSGGGRGGR
jgi:type II secretory pathway component GspD/PulD (secretin)